MSISSIKSYAKEFGTGMFMAPILNKMGFHKLYSRVISSYILTEYKELFTEYDENHNISDTICNAKKVIWVFWWQGENELPEIVQACKNSIYENRNGYDVIYITKDNTEYQVKQEDTGNYYIEKNGNKEYLELNSVPLVAKVDMNKNTLITTELISKSDNIVQDDVRRQEYNMIVLPADLATGDYIDIRLMLPSGQDYIVVSKKEVEIPNIGGVDSSDTIWVNLSEDETLHLSCAIVDAFKINGAKLYATKYTEAGMQEAAKVTYVMTQEATKLLENDPNILERAMNEIRSRYNSTATLRNDYINKEIENQGDQAQTNYQTNMSDSVTNSKNTRKEYLDSLSGVVE